MQPIHHRRAQLLQRRERKLHLRLHTDRPHHRNPGAAQAQTPQRRLTDPRSPETTSTRLCHPRGRKQAIQRLALVAPVVQHPARPS